MTQPEREHMRKKYDRMMKFVDLMSGLLMIWVAVWVYVYYRTGLREHDTLFFMLLAAPIILFRVYLAVRHFKCPSCGHRVYFPWTKYKKLEPVCPYCHINWETGE